MSQALVVPAQSAPLLAQPNRAPRLLDSVRDTAIKQGYPLTTIATFVDWTRRYVRFHDCRHPRNLALDDIVRFENHVSQSDNNPLVAVTMARMALEFLYREVLHHNVEFLPLPKPPRLLDQVKQVMRVRHYSPRTEDSYVQWIKRYILFHGKRHRRPMGTLSAQDGAAPHFSPAAAARLSDFR